MPLAFVVPGPLDAVSGGSIYDRHLVEGLRASGWDVTVIEAAGTFPVPAPADAGALDAALAALPRDTVTVVDGLVFGGIPDLAERYGRRLRFVALVHLPLAADPTVPPDAADAFRAGEARALRQARRVIVTGTVTRDLLRGYGVPDAAISLVEPGTVRPDAGAVAAACADRAAPTGPVRLLSVGTLHAGKGHLRLVRALGGVAAPWHLTCAGSLTVDPETVQAVRDAAGRCGCSDRVRLAGLLKGDALASAYASADVFVLATSRETYGMAVAEALSWHLPVVATDTGAIAMLAGQDAGLVVPVHDDRALADALSRVIEDGPLRARLGSGARAAAARLPTWDDQVAAFARALETS